MIVRVKVMIVSIYTYIYMHMYIWVSDEDTNGVLKYVDCELMLRMSLTLEMSLKIWNVNIDVESLYLIENHAFVNEFVMLNMFLNYF